MASVSRRKAAQIPTNGADRVEMNHKNNDYDTQSREYNYENRPRETYKSQPGKHYYYESEKASNDQVEKELESLLLAQEDVPVQTENASLFCAVSGNCSSCVAQDVCFWCQTKQRCYSYFNDSW